MASSDLIVRVKMADVQKFVADGKSVQSTTDAIGDSADRSGRVGSAGFGLMSKALTILRRTAYLAGGSMTALSALVIKNGLSYNAAFQSATTSFTTLLGSSDKAKQLMDDLREVSNGTPLRFTEVLDASKRMLGMGVSADRTVKVLKGLNAAILATGGGSEQFDRASLALGQMGAKGKASAEELMQLAEAGVPVNKILQRELGLTAGEVAEIGKSGIASGKVLDAIARGWQREFGQAAKNARNDWNNQTAQIVKDWEQFQRVITEPLFIRLNTDVMPAVMRTIREATKGFQQGFESGGIMAGFDLMFRRMDVAAGAGGNLIKAWRGLLNVGRDLGRIVTDGIVPGIMILAGVFSGLPTPLGTVTDLLGFLADHTEIVTGLVVVGGGAWLAYAAATTAVTAATGILTGAQKALNFVMNMNPIVRVITVSLLLAAGLKMLYERSETFRNAVQWLWDKIKSTFDWVRANWPMLLTILTGPFGIAVAVIAKNWDKIKAGASTLKDWLKAAWNGVGSALAAPFQAAWGIIKPIVDKIQSAVDLVRSMLPGGTSAAQVQAGIDAATGRRSGQPGAGVPGQGGGSWGGSTIARGGSLVVGERGRELVTLPAGAQVHRHSVTEQSLRNPAVDGRPLQVQLVLPDGRVLTEMVMREVRAVMARA